MRKLSVWYALVILSITTGIISSCSNTCQSVLDDDIDIYFKVSRLELDYEGIQNISDAEKVLEKNPVFTKYCIETGRPKEQVVKDLFGLSQAPYGELMTDVKKQFKDFEKEGEQKLSALFKNIKYYYSDFKAPEVVTIVSGFQAPDLVDGGKIILIGTDYYLDSTATYLPPKNAFPVYLKRHMVRENLDSKIASLMANRFVGFDQSDQTIINRMILYGKLAYFVHTVLPCKAEANILEYTPKEWSGIEFNAYKIYTHFTQNELFYSTKKDDQRIYVDPRPNVVEIGDDCPGRIGQWLGYEIVKSYMKRNEIELTDLMQDTDHKKIFMQSGYKPELSK